MARHRTTADRAAAILGLAAFARLVDDIPGSSFALIMATGIVSNASGLLGLGGLAEILFAINLIAFPTLSVVVLFRLVKRP